MLTEEIPLVQKMKTLSPEERQKTMAAGAETLGNYYQTDPEVLEWLAFAEDVLDDTEDLS